MSEFGLAMVGPKASYALAIAVLIASFLRFFRWVITFTFERLDVSRGHLGTRLKHVEAELDAYREVAMLMIGVVAKLDADNPALVLAAQLLRTTTPRASMDLDDLTARLAAMPGTKEEPC